jgi:hypothetical protein
MKSNKIANLLQKLRTPTAILSFALLCGLALNVLFIVVGLSPRLVIQNLLSGQVERLELEKGMLQAKTLPSKVSEPEIKALVAKVPSREEGARVILSLRNIEKRTGAIISTVTFGDTGQSKDEIMITQTISPTPSLKPATGDAKEDSALIQKENVSISIVGTYSQVLDFVKYLQEEERLFRITKWQINTGNQGEPTADSSTSFGTLPSDPNYNDAPWVDMSFEFEIYWAKSYAGKFPDLPDLTVSSTEFRQDPTLTDNAYWQIVEELINKRVR